MYTTHTHPRTACVSMCMSFCVACARVFASVFMCVGRHLNELMSENLKKNKGKCHFFIFGKIERRSAQLRFLLIFSSYTSYLRKILEQVCA